MNYSNVLDLFFLKFPEFIKYVELEDIDSGLYIAFGLGINPRIIELLKNHEDHEKELINLFDFFELMAICEGEDVRDLLTYSLLERLGDYPHILKLSYKYMKKETYTLSRKIEAFLGRGKPETFDDFS